MNQGVSSRRVGLGIAAASSLCLLAPGAAASAPAAHHHLALTSGAAYVAMGSSYAAGFLIKPQDPDAGTCGRSFIDYPQLVVKKLGLDLTDVSCGGAVTANAIDTDQGAAPPQIDAVTAKTRLVTMTIGGNDVNYVGTAGHCGSAASNCAKNFDTDQLDTEFQQLPHSLKTLIAAIRAKAPKVTIVIVAYPRLVPAKTCAALNYKPAEARLVASIGSRLEKVFVKVAKQTHVVLADPYPLAAGHGPCAPAKDRWVAGNNPTNGAMYHPTAAGHRAMAHLVEKALAKK